MSTRIFFQFFPFLGEKTRGGNMKYFAASRKKISSAKYTMYTMYIIHPWI